MSSDNHNKFGVHLDREEQKVNFPIGLAFDGSKIPEGKRSEERRVGKECRR